ncbi:MAG TPA: DHH family phosphoesterase [Candidatus Saccharimonadales bacterium]|nr:DHH family phosphoesterase [Candidatus Saccharimonadales bacterium]
MQYPEAQQISDIVAAAPKIVIIQADNPDGDSLGSALALEHILGEMGKEPYLYCAVDMPTYLRYMQGWDRVQRELPKQFDASIIVDASTMTLFERLEQSGEKAWLAAKPCVVLDHHETVDNLIPFATITINDSKRASAGELIYYLAKQLKWPLSVQAQECLMTSILGDTQGLTNQLASSGTYRIMAEFVDAGVNRPALEELRREYGKMPPEIYKYKADLIQRTHFENDGAIAWVSVPQKEINQYSPLYNPAPLIQNDMLQTSGVRIAIVFKAYDDGRVTAAIRTASDSPVAAQLAEKFGGGGHANASGFKVTDGRSLEQVKTGALSYAAELLATLDKTDETIQHAYKTD